MSPALPRAATIGDTRCDTRVTSRTIEPTTLGSGFLSGLLSALFGIAGLGAVLCLHFPELLTHPQLRALYEVAAIRPVIHLALVAAFVLGTISAWRRTNKALAVTGLGTTLAAALLGGSRVPVGSDIGAGSWLGVDFFVLNLLLYSGVFIPLERFFALRAEQPVFRRQWVVDLTYFFLNSLLVEVLTLFTLQPASMLFGWARFAKTAGAGALPLIIQVPLIVLLADFTQYWVHRMFHTVPFLWPFHAIHHSTEQMDWLAGSRLHLVDVIVTRALIYMPIFVLGFSEAAVLVYVFLVAAQATFIHANVRWEFRAIRRIVATPAFHHWHHSAAPEAVNRNFAVHVPVWDILFGSYHLPNQWPDRYGIADGRTVPPRWTTQLLYPFRRSSGTGSASGSGNVVDSPH